MQLPDVTGSAEGLALYGSSREATWRRVYAHRSTAGHELPAAWAAESFHKTVKAPKLLRTYLELSAWICGPPAIDRDFRTIDFLTLLDLEQISARFRAWLRAEG